MIYYSYHHYNVISYVIRAVGGRLQRGRGRGSALHYTLHLTSRHIISYYVISYTIIVISMVAISSIIILVIIIISIHIS